MTNYKTGDKVLVEAEVYSVIDSQNAHLKIWNANNKESTLFYASAAISQVRPYTPRQEFEYGEEVEAKSRFGVDRWFRARYIGLSHCKDPKRQPFPIIVNEYESNDFLSEALFCKEVRKPKPRDTITIAGVTYYKDDVEAATKDLKPAGESK